MKRRLRMGQRRGPFLPEFLKNPDDVGAHLAYRN
jgi:hypothetical protein